VPASGSGGAPASGVAAREEAPDRRAAWVLRDGRPTSVSVRVGVTDGTHTEILDGTLSEGDLVITDMVAPKGARPPGGGAGGGMGGMGGMRRIL
jgi:HlyD family secretion protein